MPVINMRLRRSPNAAAAALSPSVAGPGLPVSANAAITKALRFSAGISSSRGSLFEQGSG
jgi:hypothetical protein